jgi:hypothetical protein
VLRHQAAKSPKIASASDFATRADTPLNAAPDAVHTPNRQYKRESHITAKNTAAMLHVNQLGRSAMVPGAARRNVAATRHTSS